MAKRITFALHDQDVERMRRGTEMTGISQAKLISCLLAVDDEEMQRIVVINLPKISDEKRNLRKAASEKRKTVSDVIKTLTPDQVKSIIEAITTGKAS